MKPAIILSILAIAISGCGKSPEPSKTSSEIPATSAAVTTQAPSSVESKQDSAVQCKTSPNLQLPTPIANVTEAELGLALYPGAKQSVGKGFQATGPEGSNVSVDLETNDPPEKVLAFYRERLKAQAEGRELIDGGAPNRDGNSMLELEATVGKRGVSVLVTGDSHGTAMSLSTACVVK